MSDIPPPPQFAAYPRGQQVALYGSADKLQALGEGYFGLNNVFLVNILLALASNLVIRGLSIPFAFLGVIGVVFVIIAGLTYPQNKKIAYGKNWPDGYAVLASVLIGLNSALCCGIVGYIVMQSLAMNEMKLYGLKAGLFSFKKSVFQEALRQRRLAEGASV